MPEEIIVVSPISFQILLTVWSQFSLDYVLPVAFIIVDLTPHFSLSLVCLCMLFFDSLPFCRCVCLFVCFVCFCLFSFYRNLFIGEMGKIEDRSQWVSKINIFLFIEEFPLSLPIILEVIRWDSYRLILTAQPSCKQKNCK